jgi:hypothetical protein
MDTRRNPRLEASPEREAVVRLVDHEIGSREGEIMNILVAILAIVAVILLITGGVVPTLNFLLWVGLVVAVIAVIVFLVRYIGGNRTV